MVDLGKATSELSVNHFKVEAAAWRFAEKSTVMFSAERVQFGPAEAHLALAMNDQHPLLFALNCTPGIQLCIEWMRASVLCVKPPEAPNCSCEGRMHDPSVEPKTLVRRFEERKYGGLLFSANKRLAQGAAEIGPQPTIMKVRYRPRLAGCQRNLLR